MRLDQQRPMYRAIANTLSLAIFSHGMTFWLSQIKDSHLRISKAYGTQYYPEWLKQIRDLERWSVKNDMLRLYQMNESSDEPAEAHTIIEKYVKLLRNIVKRFKKIPRHNTSQWCNIYSSMHCYQTLYFFYFFYFFLFLVLLFSLSWKFMSFKCKESFK